MSAQRTAVHTNDTDIDARDKNVVIALAYLQSKGVPREIQIATSTVAWYVLLGIVVLACLVAFWLAID